MKILIISRVGEEAHTRKIPAALAGVSHAEVGVVVPEEVAVGKSYNPEGRVHFEKGDAPAGCRFFPVRLRDPDRWWLNFEGAGLRRAVEEFQPDIIQFWGGPADPGLLQVLCLNSRIRPRAKVFFYGFDNLPLDFGPWYKSWYWKLRWRLAWRGTAGGFEADSEAVGNVLKAGYTRPLRRVFWGVPEDIFRPMPGMDRRARRRGLGLDCPRLVGYAGRLVPEKGLNVLLSALVLLAPEVHCLIVGDGPEKGELLRQAAASGVAGRVHFQEAVSPPVLAEYMNCLDALALPSLTTPTWKEQYGRVLAEAMACAVPVVGSDSGAIPEVVAGAGLIVPENDPPSLTRAIQRAIFDQTFRRKAIPAGLERAKGELSIEAMARSLYEAYRVTQ